MINEKNLTIAIKSSILNLKYGMGFNNIYLASKMNKTKRIKNTEDCHCAKRGDPDDRVLFIAERMDGDTKRVFIGWKRLSWHHIYADWVEHNGIKTLDKNALIKSFEDTIKALESQHIESYILMRQSEQIGDKNHQALLEFPGDEYSVYNYDNSEDLLANLKENYCD